MKGEREEIAMKILFPVVRFTTVSAMLVPFVTNMATVFKAQIHVLRVESLMDQFIEMRIKDAEEWLDGFINEHLKWHFVHRAPVIPGDPAQEILKYIDENEIDCAIIGTHGRKGLNVIFGSVAQAIVGRSTVPVLTINPYLTTKSLRKRNAVYLEKLRQDICSSESK